MVPRHGTDWQAGQPAGGLHLCFLQDGWFLQRHRTPIAVARLLQGPVNGRADAAASCRPQARWGRAAAAAALEWPSDPLRTLAAQGLFVRE